MNLQAGVQLSGAVYKYMLGDIFLFFVILTFTSCFVIDYLSIIIFSAIATNDRHPL